MSTADIERIERQLEALEKATQGKLEGPLGELHSELSAIVIYLKRMHMQPTKTKSHDVPSVEGTVMERTFTGTFAARMRGLLRRR